MSVKKIAILFSGTGSNLETLIKKLHNKTFNGTTIKVALTVCNKPQAKGIEKSRNLGIEPLIIDNKNYKNREEFDQALVDIIKEAEVDLTVLAGFMRILTPYFTKNIKAINLHPSLLPLFKGGNAIVESFNSDMKVGGISVHYVSEELDSGEIIAQKAFDKTKGMDLEKFKDVIHSIEHELLPQSVVDILCH